MDEFSKFLEYLYVTGELDDDKDDSYDDSDEEDKGDNYIKTKKK